MGNICVGLSSKEAKKKKKKKQTSSKRFSSTAAAAVGLSSRWLRAQSARKDELDDAAVREQAFAAAVLFRKQQHHLNGVAGTSLPFDRSASLRHPPASAAASAAMGSKKQSLPRSSSSRARSRTDPLLQPHQLVNQILKLDDLETNHFVLVHGGGFGAWCWYKTIALLEEGGFKVTAIDLFGSGVHSFDSNRISSLSQYARPLIDFLETIAEGEKVILVGHDFGGSCVSYAAELFPLKVSKAVFIAATMLASGQSTLDMFSQQDGSNDMMLQAQIFLYGNGKDHPPTAIDFDRAFLRDLLFNQCPAKDVALASVSMRPIPFAPVLEKLVLSDTSYGTVRRFYIKTMEDNAVPVTVQDKIINANPPEAVFCLKGADHSPFFSKPQGLHKLLVEISKIH